MKRPGNFVLTASSSRIAPVAVREDFHSIVGWCEAVLKLQTSSSIAGFSGEPFSLTYEF